MENSTATFSELKPNTVYNFCVCGIDEEKHGEWSEVLQIKSAPGPPCPPSKPAIQVVSAGEVCISINKLPEEEQNGSPVTQFIVEECSTEHTNWKPSYKFSIDTDQPIIQKLVPLADDICYFRIVMVNDIGESKPSEWVLVPDRDLIPGPPQNDECSKITCNELQLSWEKPSVFPRVAKQGGKEKKGRQMEK